MTSLTPQSRSDEVTYAAMKDGFISGGLALIPSYGAVWLAMKRSPSFVKSTNWQSRTALVVMPTLFFFAYAAESKLHHRMQEVAKETEHVRASARWAEAQQQQLEQQQQQQQPSSSSSSSTMTAVESMAETERQLTELYRRSVMESGVRIVPGNRLGLHHQMSNFIQENPFKVLAAFGIPAVAYIYHGRSGQEHLQLQSKIMHTRVFGQFAIICGLVSLMGFKEHMDRNGRYITESEAEDRVRDMKAVRQDLLERLRHAREEREEQRREVERAHREDDANHARRAHGGTKHPQGEEGNDEDDDSKADGKEKAKTTTTTTTTTTSTSMSKTTQEKRSSHKKAMDALESVSS